MRYSIIGKFYSQEPTSSRNVALDDAKQVIEYLTKHHDLNCIIVTDKDGMDYFYDLKNFKKNVLFSKEILIHSTGYTISFSLTLLLCL